MVYPTHWQSLCLLGGNYSLWLRDVASCSFVKLLKRTQKVIVPSCVVFDSFPHSSSFYQFLFSFLRVSTALYLPVPTKCFFSLCSEEFIQEMVFEDIAITWKKKIIGVECFDFVGFFFLNVLLKKSLMNINAERSKASFSCINRMCFPSWLLNQYNVFFLSDFGGNLEYLQLAVSVLLLFNLLRQRYCEAKC